MSEEIPIRMEQNPESESDLTKEGMPRRKFLKGMFATATSFSLPLQEKIVHAEESGEKTSFTLEEIAQIYKQEYSLGKRMRNHVHAVGEKNELIATFEGSDFLVPQTFIDSTVRHLQEMYEARSLRYIHRLDSYHGHLFIPDGVNIESYDDNYEHVIEKALQDSRTGTLYHNSEFLVAKNSTDQEALLQLAKRNVIGWQDGRPIEIIPPAKDGSGITPLIVKNGQQIVLFHYSATRNGEFEIEIAGEKIRIDISFDAK
jgi:hypothetical protein